MIKNMAMDYQILISVFAFLAVAALMPLARVLALRAGFVDAPDKRKVHEGLVPPIGGLVIFPVYMLALVLAGQDMGAYWPLMFALGLLVVTGAVDDYAHINPWIKFFIQIFAALVVLFFGDLQLHHLGDIFSMGTLWLGFMALPFSLAAIVLLINAVNLMDGLDGLAGGKSFVMLGWFALAAWLAGHEGELQALAPLLAALAGFLVYNMRSPLRARASVFLGDAGSLGLGLVLAWFSIKLAQPESGRAIEPIAVAWVLALPIMDECAQFYRRVREGRHPFAPDRGHFHHHLLHAGFGAGQATFVILLLGMLTGAIGYGGLWLGVPEVVLTLLWIAALLTHMYLSEKPQVYIGFFKRITDSK